MSAGEPSIPPRPRYCYSDLERVLLTEQQIAARVSELGQQLTRDYADHPPLVLGVLTGAFVFLADLLRQVDLPCRVDFVGFSSYGRETEPCGAPILTHRPRQDWSGQRVLVVEDIVDTGHTLARLRQWLEQTAQQVRVCALLDKADRRQVPVPVEYVGFRIPDHFVVGYGLDFAGGYRNLPYLAVLKPEVYRREEG